MKLLNTEWIVSTGSGSFATSTVSLANTRKQQGIFIAPTREGFQRYLYVSRIEDELIRESTIMNLTTCVYRNAVFPEGYKNLQNYGFHPLTSFAFKDEFVTVRKTVRGIPGENSIVLRYGIESKSKGTLKLRPVLGLRYIHTLRKEREIPLGIRPSVRGVFLRPGEHPVPPLIILASSGQYQNDFCWYRHFSYVQDRMKGEACEEDLPSPGYFLIPVSPEKNTIFVIFTLEEKWLELFDDRARGVEVQIKKALRGKGEQVSRISLPHHFQKNFDPLEDSALSLISAIGDKSFATAGYPYYPVNVYDLILYIKDFLLRGGYISTASSMIDFLSPFLRNGLLPKYIDEEGEPLYCSADTSLLFVELLSRYLNTTGNRAEIERNLQLIGDIINCYMEGTEYDTKMGDDHLITCGREGIEATWMDRVAGRDHITRRYGRAVDTNALWYNALCSYRDLAMAVGYKKDSQKITKIIPRIKTSFLKNFVITGNGYLVDVIQDGTKIPRLRPNQLLALTLSNPLISPTFGRRMLQNIKDSLVTDYGLRTLAPADRDFSGRLEGTERERLHALFNGCVLPHLALQYADALLYVYGPKNRVVNRIRRFLLKLRRVAEIKAPYFLPEAFDGNPPHEPKGSPVSLASTGSVMGLFRLYDSIKTSS